MARHERDRSHARCQPTYLKIKIYTGGCQKKKSPHENCDCFNYYQVVARW